MTSYHDPATGCASGYAVEYLHYRAKLRETPPSAQTFGITAGAGHPPAQADRSGDHRDQGRGERRGRRNGHGGLNARNPRLRRGFEGRSIGAPGFEPGTSPGGRGRSPRGRAAVRWEVKYRGARI